ncbi:hypothetical protein [Deinococcus roseus]|uniref:hypothetical protein n=1 Tax=Deinococcus roseus TaxID=392414 RepID=UPI00166D5C6A|nr:hypothetical protein [Deinococcus roseus]
MRQWIVEKREEIFWCGLLEWKHHCLDFKSDRPPISYTKILSSIYNFLGNFPNKCLQAPCSRLYHNPTNLTQTLITFPLQRQKSTVALATFSMISPCSGHQKKQGYKNKISHFKEFALFCSKKQHLSIQKAFLPFDNTFAPFHPLTHATFQKQLDMNLRQNSVMFVTSSPEANEGWQDWLHPAACLIKKP